MKKTMILLILFCIVNIIGFKNDNVVLPTVHAEQVSANYPVIEDTYTWDKNPNTPYGSSDRLDIRNVSAVNYSRKTYIKVNFAALKYSAIHSATLNFYYAENPPKSGGTLNIKVLADDTWSEDSVTWNTPPSESSYKTYLYTQPVVPGWNSIEATKIVNDQMTDKVITFMLTESSNVGGIFSICSSEHADISLRPYLNIVADAPDPIFTYKNATNTTVNRLENASGGTIQVSANSTVSASLVLALYNSKGALQRIAVDKRNVTGGIQTAFSAAISGLPQNLSGYYAKAFMLDGLTTVKPLRSHVDTGLKNYMISKDAYVYSLTGFTNTNFGSNSYLFATSIPSSSQYQYTYMMADFGDYDAGFADSGKLYFYVNSVNSSNQIRVYGLTDDSWGENTITWNNQPADDDNAVLVRCVRVKAPGWYSVDVTDFINLQMNTGDKKVTFKLVASSNSSSTCGTYDIASREATVGKPYLELSGEREGLQARDSRAFVDSMGVNTHLYYNWTPYMSSSFYPTLKARIDELGVRHLRDAAIQHSKNTQAEVELVRSRMKDLAQLNDGLRFSVVANVVYSAPDPNLLDQSYAAAGSAWDAILGMNEPDGFIGTNNNDPNWPLYAQNMQKFIWQWVTDRGLHDSLDVVGPNMGNWLNYTKTGDLAMYMDYGDLHSYVKGNQPVSFNVLSGGGGQYMASIEDMRITSGNKPYFVTETGWSNWTDGTDPNIAAKHLTRAFFYNWNAGAMRTFVYELLNENDKDSANNEGNFGLLRSDGTPKPAFFAMKNMITVLDDPNTPFVPGKLNFRLGGNTQYVRYSLLQKRDGRFYLALWLERPVDTTSNDVTQNVTLTFHNESIDTVKSCRIKDTASMAPVITDPSPGYAIPITLYDDVVLFEIKKH